MNADDRGSMLPALQALAREAGAAIMQVFAHDFAVLH